MGHLLEFVVAMCLCAAMLHQMTGCRGMGPLMRLCDSLVATRFLQGAGRGHVSTAFMAGSSGWVQFLHRKPQASTVFELGCQCASETGAAEIATISSLPAGGRW